MHGEMLKIYNILYSTRYMQWRIEGRGFKLTPSPRNSEGPPKSCQTQPESENR